MDKAFQDLEKTGKNDVDNLIKWMKDSKIIDSSKDDEGIRKLFKSNDAKQKVDLEKFKEVVAQVAKDQKKTTDTLSQKLAETAPKVLDAAKKGIDAIKGALKIDK
ncbi:hypothetical protein PYW07_011561 [Mythimna separata]|uniref:Uncharacterized protein n=1 Tax=Mythimna separata TaxID=271217 RepID=A0AAD7YA33_MYTSE|nr:hypothetical protein PYW07_011561 [Mythimna separata]